jgi:hypothetical protein
MQAPIKMFEDEFPLGVMLVVERCVGGFQMVWARYLLNKFVDDYIDAQTWENNFTATG